MRSLRIISCLALVTIATSSNCWAQEVGSLDLTKMVMRRDFRRPAGTRQGPAVFDDWQQVADKEGTFNRLVGVLSTTEQFYGYMGGIIGYHPMKEEKELPLSELTSTI